MLSFLNAFKSGEATRFIGDCLGFGDTGLAERYSLSVAGIEGGVCASDVS